MRNSKSRLLACLLAGTFVTSFGGPATAREELFTLRVPVKLKQMLVQQFHLTCRLLKDGQELGRETVSPEITNGEFDSVVEVVFRHWSGSERVLAGANSYTCWFTLQDGRIAVSRSFLTPRQGTPPAADLPALAKPDEFFRKELAHSIGPGKPTDGIAGPGGLTGPSKPRQ